MTTLEIKVVNEHVVLKALSNLKTRTAKTIARKAVNAGAAPIVKAIRRNVPKDTGTLKRSVSKRVMARVAGPGYEAKIGARRRKRDAKTRKFPARHWHLADQGFGPHKITHKETGKRLWTKANKFPLEVNHPGFHGHHFVRRSFNEAKSDAERKLREKLTAEILAAARAAS